MFYEHAKSKELCMFLGRWQQCRNPLIRNKINKQLRFLFPPANNLCYCLLRDMIKILTSHTKRGFRMTKIIYFQIRSTRRWVFLPAWRGGGHPQTSVLAWPGQDHLPDRGQQPPPLGNQWNEAGGEKNHLNLFTYVFIQNLNTKFRKT